MFWLKLFGGHHPCQSSSGGIFGSRFANKGSGSLVSPWGVFEYLGQISKTIGLRPINCHIQISLVILTLATTGAWN